MNKKPIRLGELLIELGRVTREDVERALAFQAEHGGYMGDALVTLGILSRDELWWGLADQHDIPFVHLKAEHIDHGLAARVPEAWAREHSVLPVLWDEGRVTVVMRDVPAPEKLEQVKLLTGAVEVVPALSSPDSIAELIEAVHGSARRVGLADLVAEALRLGATAFGLSIRPDRALGWYRYGEAVSRPLGPDWRAELGRLVAPAATELADEGPVRWAAMLRVGSELRTLDCRAVASGGALEWAAVPGEPLNGDPGGTAADPRLERLARGARRPEGIVAGVECDAGADRAAEALLTMLPARLLGSGVRALHLADRTGGAPPGMLGILLAAPLASAAPGLELFCPDAVTVCVETLDVEDLAALRRLAPFVAVLPRSGSPGVEFDCMVRLRATGAGYAWTLLAPR